MSYLFLNDQTVVSHEPDSELQIYKLWVLQFGIEFVILRLLGQ